LHITVYLVSKRTLKKYKILNALEKQDLSAEDIETYTTLEQSNLRPIMRDLIRWNDIEVVDTECYYSTGRERNIYGLRQKGQKKLEFFKNKYNLQ